MRQQRNHYVDKVKIGMMRLRKLIYQSNGQWCNYYIFDVAIAYFMFIEVTSLLFYDGLLSIYNEIDAMKVEVKYLIS